MSEESHPHIPESIFDEEDCTIEKEWQVYLTALEPLPVDSVHHAICNESYSDTLEDMDLIPELIRLTTVSFYYTGTFRDAYIAARRKCDELNEAEDVPCENWDYERGSIVYAGE